MRGPCVVDLCMVPAGPDMTIYSQLTPLNYPKVFTAAIDAWASE